MTEEKTAKLGSPDPGSSSVQEVVRQLIAKVTDLSGLLRSQQDILRKRGMNLPTGSLDSLRNLQQRLEALNKNLMNTQIELRQLRALAQNTALINSSLDPNEVLNQVMDTVVQLTGAERGYIMLRNKLTNEIEPRIMRGMDQETLAKNEFVVSRTVVAEVIEKGEPVLTDNASKDQRYQGQASIVGFALRSILCVPLKVLGDVIGVVYCDNRILAGLFKQHELDLLTAFANQSAVAIENARLFEDMRRQLDEITQIRDLINGIFESIVTGVITVSNEGVVLETNTAAERILGAVGPSAKGKQISEVLPLDESFGDVLHRVYESGKTETTDARPTVEGLGARTWNLVVSPLRDQMGAQQGLVVVVDDLTETKAREAQLAQVRRYLPLAQLENVDVNMFDNVQVEEREITAVFADVRGFTSFSENLDPQELMQIINRYLDVASEGISLQAGLVDKYMGDAVTGLFNTQMNPQPDHAVRCVRAAMSIIYDLYALHEVLPENQRLFYGIGVHTGEAVLGNIGGKERKEFGALGEATQISKLLQENALGGEVIISDATYSHVKDFFECEEIEPRKPAKPGMVMPKMYKVLRRKKGATSRVNVPVDPELLDLLKD